MGSLGFGGHGISHGQAGHGIKDKVLAMEDMVSAMDMESALVKAMEDMVSAMDMESALVKAMEDIGIGGHGVGIGHGIGAGHGGHGFGH